MRPRDGSRESCSVNAPVHALKRTGDDGGVMLAVCGLELWPEGRRCRRDARLAQGIALGAAAMLWTLWVGV